MVRISGVLPTGGGIPSAGVGGFLILDPIGRESGMDLKVDPGGSGSRVAGSGVLDPRT